MLRDPVVRLIPQDVVEYKEAPLLGFPIIIQNSQRTHRIIVIGFENLWVIAVLEFASWGQQRKGYSITS